jgi:hypothetical protein
VRQLLEVVGLHKLEDGVAGADVQHSLEPAGT